MNRGFDNFYTSALKSGGNFAKKMKFNNEIVTVDNHRTDNITDYAFKILAKDQDQPFFMFLSYFAPHTPLQATPEEIKKASGNKYHAMIQNMDRNVGRVIAQLKEDGRYGNTIIWFLSDNGGAVAQAKNLPLNGQKGIKLEGGQRVPFTMTWPAKLKGGRKYAGLTSSMDIFATSFALCGGKTTLKPLDGVNIFPYLTGQKKGEPHNILLWRKLEGAAVRIDDWKLIRAEGVPMMLYNLKDDLSERNNLAESNPEKVQELLKRLETWEKELQDPFWNEGKHYVKKRKGKYL